MEIYFVRPDYWATLYNCTGIDVDSIPLERRQFVKSAVVTFALCVVYYILYIPCMISIWRQIPNNECYKLLFYIGVTDMSVLIVLGFMQPYYGIVGSAFCSSPVFFYVLGTITTCLWCAEGTSDLILAFNRCLATVTPKGHKLLFKGHKMHVWLLLCSAYAVYGLLFEKPLLYAPTVFAWSYNPLEGYQLDTDYIYGNTVNDIIETTVALGSPAIYLVFGVVMWVKKRALGSAKLSLSPAERSTFLQVFLISMLNCSMCTFALLFHRYPELTTEWMVLIAQFSWFHIHGFPPVIYLALNKTIRSDCRKLFFRLIGRPDPSVSTAQSVCTALPKSENGGAPQTEDRPDLE